MKKKVIIAGAVILMSVLLFALGVNATDADVSSTENNDGPKITFECYEDGSTKIIK